MNFEFCSGISCHNGTTFFMTKGMKIKQCILVKGLPPPLTLTHNNPTQSLLSFDLIDLRYFKNWKRRWFVLYRNELKYFNTRGDSQPLRIIKLEDATSAERDETAGKPFCFRYVRICVVYCNVFVPLYDCATVIA